MERYRELKDQVNELEKDVLRKSIVTIVIWSGKQIIDDG